MANTTSWNFPNLINVSQNTISILEDEDSIANRDKLLILTEPTEMYNDSQFGVGLKRYLGTYNNDNTLKEIQDRIANKLRMYEPCVDVDKSLSSQGLLYSGSNSDHIVQTNDDLELTIALSTIYGTQVEINLNS